MNIGYIHFDQWPTTGAHDVMSWQIISRLIKKYSVYTLQESPYPGHYSKIYKNKWDSFRFAKPLDVLFIMVDGRFKWYTEKLTLLSLLRYPKIPVVWYINAPIDESLMLPWYPQQFFPLDRIKRNTLARLVDASACVSESVKHYAQNELKIRDSRVIECGADPVLFNPHTKNRTFISDLKGYFKILWAGDGKYPWQALDVISAVAKRLLAIDRKIIFFLLTDDTWTPIPHLENICIIRRTTPKLLPAYIHGADVCLCLYHKKTQYGVYNSPMKLFDYMAMEKPIIASSEGQMKDILLAHKCGLLTDNSVDDIISKLLLLKKHKHLGTQMGQRARKLVMQYYNWDRFFIGIDGLLNDVITKKSREQNETRQ